MRSLVYAAAAATVVLATSRAQADAGRAWTTARDNLPGNASVVIGADLGAIAKSQLFGTLFPLALSRQAELEKGFELVKKTCKIDPLTAVHGVVVGTDADHKEGASYLALGGIDQPKLIHCLEDIAKANGVTGKVTLKKSGAITEIAMGADKVYVSWFGGDVVALALDIRDRAQLQKWTGQKGALRGAPIGKAIASVDTKAALWGASTVAQTVRPGVNVKQGYGALTVANGNLATDLHVALDSAKAATDTVADANQQLAKVSGGMPANLQALLKGISITAAGADVIIKASIAEADLMMLLGAFLGGGP